MKKINFETITTQELKAHTSDDLLPILKEEISSRLKLLDADFDLDYVSICKYSGDSDDEGRFLTISFEPEDKENTLYHRICLESDMYTDPEDIDMYDSEYCTSGRIRPEGSKFVVYTENYEGEYFNILRVNSLSEALNNLTYHADAIPQSVVVEFSELMESIGNTTEKTAIDKIMSDAVVLLNGHIKNVTPITKFETGFTSEFSVRFAVPVVMDPNSDDSISVHVDFTANPAGTDNNDLFNMGGYGLTLRKYNETSGKYETDSVKVASGTFSFLFDSMYKEIADLMLAD